MKNEGDVQTCKRAQTQGETRTFIFKHTKAKPTMIGK